MKRGAIISIIIAIILLIILGLFFSLTSSSTTPAFLYIESGEVLVDQGSGYESASDQMNLQQSWKVKTGETGKASVVVYESDLILLEPNTEILVSELTAKSVTSETTLGEATHVVSKLTGTRAYHAKTPTAVATVRGTIFTLSPLRDEVLLHEGQLELAVGEQTLLLNENKKSSLTDLKEIDMTPEDRENFQLLKQRIVKTYKQVRLRELSKKKFIVDMVKKKYKIDDAAITTWFDDADAGKYDLDQSEKRVPFKMAAVKKIKNLTERIRAILSIDNSGR